MSKGLKITLWIAVILIVVLGIWWLSTSFSNQQTNSMQGSVNTNNAQVASEATDTSITSGNSDSDLNQDLGNIDAQMNSLNTDSSNVNQSLNTSASSQ